MMLAGYLTFALTLWINDDADRKSSEPLFEPAFEALRSRETDPFERAWIECLRGSLVCDISPGSRPGGYLWGLDTVWGPWMSRFLAANVPIWVLWGELPSLQVEPRDIGMLNFRPPPGVLEEAKRRAEMIPQRPETSHLASALRVSELPPVPYAEIALDGIEYSQTEYGYNPSGPTTAPPPSLPLLEPSSGQRQGETPLAFIGRMQAQAISHLKHEGENAKQKRMSHEADARTGRFVKSASYFEWEQEEGGTWIRKKVDRKLARRVFKNYLSHQRIYLSHRHEWDMCSMHNVESVVNDEDSDDDDFGDDEGLDIVPPPVAEGDVVMGNEAGGGGSSAANVRGAEGLRMAAETWAVERSARSAEVSTDAPDVFLRSRYGFRVSSRGPVLGGKSFLETGEKSMENSIKVAFKIAGNGGFGRSNVGWAASMVEWVNTSFECNERREHLPGSWDINRRGENGLRTRVEGIQVWRMNRGGI
ncbi:hypothetical protein BD779DRAFT_1682601 [Infundibulicybe gibba]|nr:hypothetical protein BD779DRAFT_1682601 [Infundibulicybe gibba]